MFYSKTTYTQPAAPPLIGRVDESILRDVDKYALRLDAANRWPLVFTTVRLMRIIRGQFIRTKNGMELYVKLKNLKSKWVLVNVGTKAIYNTANHRETFAFEAYDIDELAQNITSHEEIIEWLSENTTAKVTGMGVKECNRMQCESIMCDAYSSEFGYICPNCLEEMKEAQKTKGFKIKEFMSTPAARLDDEQVDLDSIFN